MKTKTTIFLTGLTAVALCSANLNSFGESAPQVVTPRPDLIGVPAPELPAKAAQVIAKAKASEKETITTSVVLSGLDLYPTTAAALVGAVAKRNPSVASLATVTAVTRQPKQLDLIVQAAVAAAPSQVRKIVFDVGRAHPAQFAALAVAAYEAAPRAGNDILEALSLAIPALRPYLDQATAQLGKNGSFSEIIDRTETTVLAAARAARTTPEKFLAFNVGSKTTLALANSTPLPPPPPGQGSQKPHNEPPKSQGHHFGHVYSLP